MEDDKINRIIEQNGRLYGQILKHTFQEEDLKTQMELMRNAFKSVVDVNVTLLRTLQLECHDNEKGIPIEFAIEVLKDMKGDDEVGVQESNNRKSISDPSSETIDEVSNLRSILKAKDEVILNLQTEVKFLASNQYNSPQIQFKTDLDLCELADENSRMKLEIEQLKSDIEELETVRAMKTRKDDEEAKMHQKHEEIESLSKLLMEKEEQIERIEADCQNLKESNQLLLQVQNQLIQANNNLESIRHQAESKTKELERLNGDLDKNYQITLKYVHEMQLDLIHAQSALKEKEFTMMKREVLAAGLPKKTEQMSSLNDFIDSQHNLMSENFWRDEKNAVIEECHETIGKQKQQIKSLTNQLHERKMQKNQKRN